MAGPMTNGRPRALSWQERLNEHCRVQQLNPPVFNIVSDRRGGRTAWSSTVTLSAAAPTPSTPAPTQTLSARFWYDGQYVNNAKEDAAEVALRTLTGTPLPRAASLGGGSAAGSSSSNAAPSAPPVTSPSYSIRFPTGVVAAVSPSVSSPSGSSGWPGRGG